MHICSNKNVLQLFTSPSFSTLQLRIGVQAV